MFAPLVNTLMEKFSKMPTYLGTMDQVRVFRSVPGMVLRTVPELPGVVGNVHGGIA